MVGESLALAAFRGQSVCLYGELRERVECLPQSPHNASGKVMKSELKTLVAQH